MEQTGGKVWSEAAAGGPPGYGPPGYGPAPVAGAPAGYGSAPPQRHFATPQPKISGAYNEQQQVPPPNVNCGVPTPVASNAYQQPRYNPAVPVVAPPMPGPVMPPGQWTTGLFDMGDDPTNCVITFFLPCITFGQVAEILDQGTTSCLLAGSIWMTVLFCFGAPCFVSCLWRTKLRAKYNLPQGECGDLCLHCWCEPCALCQEYRELNNRGLDPALGWEHHRQQMYPQPMGAPQQAHMWR